MKKRYVFIAVIIVLISTCSIIMLTKFLNDLGNDKKNISYGDIKNNVERVDYYFYKKCDEEPDHIMMNYFLIDDYFLQNDEFTPLNKYINENKNILLNSKEDITCTDSSIKIIVELTDGRIFNVSSVNDSEKEFVLYIEKYLKDTLKNKEEEEKKRMEKINVNMFKASNIKDITYTTKYPWIRDYDLGGFNLKVNSNMALFENTSLYFENCKEQYEMENYNWNELTNYIEKNIGKFDNVNDMICYDCGEKTITIGLNDGTNFDIVAYGEGNANFKNLLNTIDSSVSKGSIKRYEEKVNNYSMGKEAVNSEIEEVTLIEEKGDFEQGIILRNNTLTFYLKKQNQTTSKSFELSIEVWNKITNYLDSLFIKDNNDGPSIKTIIVKRMDGSTYDSSIYTKLFEKNTYYEIIKMIGEEKYNNNRSSFEKEIR